MPQDNTTHLLRGSPAVRPWSKYQSTVPAWTLCGVNRRLTEKNRKRDPATEVAAEVTCRYCKMLMGAAAKMPARLTIAPQKRKAAHG